jgi:hypothetical protein
VLKKTKYEVYLIGTNLCFCVKCSLIELVTFSATFDACLWPFV